MTQRTIFPALFLLFWGALPCRADLTLPPMFDDHMILQRDQPVRFWGWSSPGSRVDVAVDDGPSATTVVESNGRWESSLPSMPAGGPHAVTISSDGTDITIEDVYFGDVWLCSGQSNMAMTVARADSSVQESAAADLPMIRMFKVTSPHATSPQQHCQGEWSICSPDSVGAFSATAYYFGRRLHRELQVPIALLHSSVGGTSIESWTSLPAQRSIKAIKPRLEAWADEDDQFDEVAEAAKYERALEKWTARVKAAREAEQSPPRRPKMAEQPSASRNYPANLYNGKVHPLVGYTIRGAIWYQGENSSSRGFSHLYGLQLITLVTDWRRRWQQGDFPFAWVQLPDYRQPQTDPNETTGWVLVRDGMRHALSLSNSGMAVTLGAGDAGDIHPKDKQTVGSRLAQWALVDVYGQSGMPMGPIYRSSSTNDGKISIEFDYADGLHSIHDRIEGFAIAGPDRQFVWADARVEGQRVIVSHPSITNPVSVRYAWASNPKFSLVNGDGIPASPFRTDDWDERGR
ncbi:MAG: sialate O-acetylesterase [Planctomycetota bacterium]